MPGAPLRLAADLGQRFGQAAILWGAGRRVALVWLSPHGPGEVARIERFWFELLEVGR